MDLNDCKILLVDDNQELLKMIEEILEKGGYQSIFAAASCAQARLLFEQVQPDMAILDIMLPDGDGFTLFREFREKRNMPILFLSAKDEDNDRLFGLGLGADDYITKPFLPRELLLRIRAILKRTYFYQNELRTEPQTFHLGECKVNFENATVSHGTTVMSLTAKELLLLKKLKENRGNIVTFDALCQTAWGDQYYGYENTLMVHIRHLREKIEEDPSHPRWLITARGLGYRLAK